MMQDAALAPYAEHFAGFIQGVNTEACLALTTARGFEPLNADELEELRVAIREANLPGTWPLVSADRSTFLTLGLPSDELAALGRVDVNDLYLLVVRVDGSDAEPEVEDVVREVSKVVFRSEGVN